jgi:transcriptional regulator GlxA family with amidase domain
MPFELFTVAPTTDLITMTGGLKVKPNYALDDAPSPNVIVVPAQRSAKPSLAWLKRSSEQTDVTMSVCTGAFQLGRAGLLKGLTATTHHEFWDSFAQEFPDVTLKRGVRFVDNGRIATAGGLTSGIDMALHIVARYFDAGTAARTARYMEHDSEAWREGLHASRPTYWTPL